MTGEQIKNVEIHVELVLSQGYDERRFKAIDQARAIQKDYFSVPPQLQPAFRPLMVEAFT